MKNMIALFVCIMLHNGNLQAQPDKMRADSALAVMKKVADWQLANWEKSGMRWPKWDWTNGACYTGLMAMSIISNDKKYIDAMMAIGNSLQWNTGPSRTMADDYCVGQMFSQMYNIYRQPEMLKYFKPLADDIVAAPHTEPLEWKNNIQLREWAWCDALFMGPPALAYLYKATGEKKYMDAADKLWWKTTDYLYDSTEHLFTRDSRYFEKKEANGKKVFWSRGNGWVMGGIVRMLENMPENHSGRTRLVSLYKSMAEKIASIQHADGTWHTALLDSVTYPAKETSGTGFYCYALAYGINQGILDYNDYYPVVSKAWTALTNAVHEDGMLGFVQQINEKPGAVDYSSTASYGVGAFLLAGSQVTLLFLNQSAKPFIMLSNNTGIQRTEVVTVLPYEKFASLISSFTNGDITLANALTNEEILYQLEYRGGKKPLNILVQTNLAPGSSLYINAINKKPSAIENKTYARYVPQRYDDFAWENDKIAFRMYGKALESTKENAYGLDVWVKRTNKMVINERYKRGQYHIDYGDGLDYYHVGFSLGAGNIAGFKKDSIWFSKNYTEWKILDSGALRTSFQLKYEGWNIAGKKITAVKTITLDAASQLSRIELAVSYAGNDTLPLAVGIIKRKETGQIYLNEQDGIMGYWEPRDINNGTTGVGTVFTSAITEMVVKKSHLLATMPVHKKTPFIYYTGAAWDKAGIILNAGQWITYLQNFKQQLNNPIEISISNIKK